jgi:hypothetical protein
MHLLWIVTFFYKHCMVFSILGNYSAQYFEIPDNGMMFSMKYGLDILKHWRGIVLSNFFITKTKKLSGCFLVITAPIMKNYNELPHVPKHATLKIFVSVFRFIKFIKSYFNTFKTKSFSDSIISYPCFDEWLNKKKEINLHPKHTKPTKIFPKCKILCIYFL